MINFPGETKVGAGRKELILLFAFASNNKYYARQNKYFVSMGLLWMRAKGAKRLITKGRLAGGAEEGKKDSKNRHDQINMLKFKFLASREESQTAKNCGRQKASSRSERNEKM